MSKTWKRGVSSSHGTSRGASLEYSVSSVHSVSGPWGYGGVRAPRPGAALAESRRVDAPTCGGRCESPRSRSPPKRVPEVIS